MAQDSIISVKNISKSYGKGDTIVTALNNISLDIKGGEFVMITGRNGSGKSTLLHQLGLLDQPDLGKIFIDTRDVTTLNENDRNDMRLRSLGYIFQEYALIVELTALENVMLPAMVIGASRQAKNKAKELLSIVGLEKKHHRLPSQLSGGEQQKVAIARSLINNPKIIFADEPTANLDTKASKDVLEIFKKLNQNENRTIVMVTHETEELAYSSQVITLADGRILK